MGKLDFMGHFPSCGESHHWLTCSVLRLGFQEWGAAGAQQGRFSRLARYLEDHAGVCTRSRRSAGGGTGAVASIPSPELGWMSAERRRNMPASLAGTLRMNDGTLRRPFPFPSGSCARKGSCAEHGHQAFPAWVRAPWLG